MIRSYSDQDRQACIEILEGNTPGFFIPADGDDFSRFLNNLPGPYFVLERKGTTLGCGGWAIEAGDVAVLTWGMVQHDLHGQGFGSALLRYRLEAVRAHGLAKLVRVQTAQLVQGFLARHGFVVRSVVPNGLGEGMDRVTMELQLAAAVQSAE